MYPTLQSDPAKRDWIDATVKELATFGEQHRKELDTANRANKFPRELYRELGRLGYLGPLVPAVWGGLGGGVAEYAVIAEEVGRHGLGLAARSPPRASAGCSTGAPTSSRSGGCGDRHRRARLLRVDQREERRLVVQGDEVDRRP